MRFEKLQLWLHWLENLHPQKIDLGLDRVTQVAERMQLLEPAATVITVAGTNGKGSSVQLFESVFAAAGVSTGSYTSPHVHRYNERIRINGVPVDEQEICHAFAQIDAARKEISLSYFEFSTLAALFIHQQHKVSVMLLEVGLGGRLDATNIVAADVALVTNIALDHMHYLGDTVEAIAVEKAGIARADKPLVSAAKNVTPALAHEAKRLGAKVIQTGLDFDIEIGVDSWSWKSADQEYQQLPYPKLQGRHQFDNAAGVIAALQQLPKNLLVSKAAIADGLQTSELPGRFEQVQGQSGYQMFFDVAHNPHAAQALIENLRALPEAPLHVVLGILADKDSAGLISTLAPLVSSWHVSAAEVERALPGEDLAQLIKDLDPDADVACYDSLLQAYKALDKAMVGSDRLLVTGSFHTVDEVRRLVT